MKAAVFKGLGQPLAIEEVADPQTGPGEILIKVARCGICGSDLHMTEDPFFGIPPGAVLGHEYSGEVVETGKGVSRVRAGDRVAVFPVRGCGHCANCLAGEMPWCAQMRLEGGGYGEYSVAAEAQAVRLPGGVSLEDGALVEPLAVGLHGVDISGMKPGARVLVIGAGPIGLATVFWARRLGAGRIAVTASSMRREELAMQMGASAFIDPAADPIAEVNRVLGGAPDIVYECVGKPGLIARSIDHVRPRGTVVVLGLCTLPETFMPFAAVAKEVRIQASAFYSVRDFEITADVLEAGDTAPEAMVTDTVALADMPPVFEALRHRTTQCKVLVRP
jgi:(R,R)-butanediol dehydrogenase/meso-butanediol dehydrogenase/diacetyl reductase